jgi:hypothetical protein
VVTLAFALTLTYVLVNAFGAWALSRRSRSLAGLFLMAAAALVVAAVALLLHPGSAVVPAATGATLASVASWWHARRLMRELVLWRHLLRAAYGVLLVALIVAL